MCWVDVNSVCLLSLLIGPAPTLEIVFKPRMLVQVTQRDTVFGVGNPTMLLQQEEDLHALGLHCEHPTKVCLHLRQVDLGFCIHPSSSVGL